MATLAELEHGLARAILDDQLPEELAGTRTAVYRTLVERTLLDAVRQILPRTVSRLGDRYPLELRAFLAEEGPHTRYLRDVPLELAAWGAARWEADSELPPFLGDLVRHEVAEMHVGASPSDEPPAAKSELSLAAPAVFGENARLLRARYAVHQLPTSEHDRTVPERRDVFLMLYRDAEFELRYLELTRAAFEIVTRMMQPSHTVQQAILEGAAASEVPVDDALLAGTAKLLADLAERGVLLGGA